MTTTELSYIVHLDSLIKIVIARLGLMGNRFPRDTEGKVEGVELPCRWGRNDQAIVPGGPYTVVITKGEPRRRPHRLHVVCKHCERHIPAGRLAQHMKVH